jgi:hypothetical protein
MATTYRDLIAGALRLIGIIGDGEPPSSYQSSNALFTLQEMIDSWNADDLMIYTTSFHELPITLPQQTWTIGPGGDIDVPVRPSEIDTAFLRQNASTAQPVDLPMAILSPTEWADVRSKSSASNYPRFIYMNGDWPVATLYLWPFPQVADAELHLLFNQTLDPGITLDTPENLPPAYRQALRFNLACLLAPEYGLEASQAVSMQAYKSKNIIAQNNQSIDRLDYDSAIQGTQGGKYWVGDDQVR